MATLDVLRMTMHARLHRFAVVMLPLLLLAPSAPQPYEPTGPPPLTSQVVDAETG